MLGNGGDTGGGHPEGGRKGEAQAREGPPCGGPRTAVQTLSKAQVESGDSEARGGARKGRGGGGARCGPQLPGFFSSR